MKTKLKVGQKVFHTLHQDFRKITEIKETQIFIEGSVATFDTKGSIYGTTMQPVLSLTEWNPWKGTGKFTPIDSEPQPLIGDMVWAWDEEGKHFVFANLIAKRDITVHAPRYRLCLGGDSDTMLFTKISLTPPDWILELIKNQTT